MEKIVAFEAYHTTRFETRLAELKAMLWEEMAHGYWEEAIRPLMDRLLGMRGMARIAGRTTMTTYRERAR